MSRSSRGVSPETGWVGIAAPEETPLRVWRPGGIGAASGTVQQFTPVTRVKVALGGAAVLVVIQHAL
jgi:hypothetical protein